MIWKEDYDFGHWTECIQHKIDTTENKLEIPWKFFSVLEKDGDQLGDRVKNE
jgi:hypothetical protein